MAKRQNRTKLVHELCERIIEGATVTEVCTDLGFTRVSLWRWTEEDPELRNAYARARELQAHAVAEQALIAAHGIDNYAQAADLVLEREEDKLEGMEGAALAAHQSFVNALRHAAVQRDKLRVDTLKWTAAKLAPREYGDKQQVEHSAKDGAPIPFTFRIDSPSGDSGS